MFLLSLLFTLYYDAAFSSNANVAAKMKPIAATEDGIPKPHLIAYTTSAHDWNQVLPHFTLKIWKRLFKFSLHTINSLYSYQGQSTSRSAFVSGQTIRS